MIGLAEIDILIDEVAEKLDANEITIAKLRKEYRLEALQVLRQELRANEQLTSPALERHVLSIRYLLKEQKKIRAELDSLAALKERLDHDETVIRRYRELVEACP